MTDLAPCACQFDELGAIVAPCADHRPQDPKRKPQRCKKCEGSGHNARTCGQTDDQRRANRRGKP